MQVLRRLGAKPPPQAPPPQTPLMRRGEKGPEGKGMGEDRREGTRRE